jgi:tetratricopeptide (TPR) repeat protein
VADCGVPALLHEGYRPELLAQGSKAQRLRQAMEQELEQRPNDAYACAKLGSLEVSEGNLAQGIALLRRGLEHCPANDHPERYELLLHLGIATAEADPGGGASLYRQALALPLPQRLSLGARLNLAALLLEQGDLVEALRAAGFGASASGVMAGQVRSDAPWPELLEIARRLAG